MHGNSDIKLKIFPILQNVQTGSGAPPEFFPGVKSQGNKAD